MPLDRALFEQTGNVVDAAIGVSRKAGEVGFLVHILHRETGALLGVVFIQQIDHAVRVRNGHARKMVCHQVGGQVAPVGLDLVRQMQDERGPELRQFLGALECRFHLGICLGVHAGIVRLSIVVSLKHFGLVHFIHIHRLTIG